MIEGVTFDWWNTIARTTPDQDRALRDLRIERLLRAMAGLPVTEELLRRAYDRQTSVLEEGWGRNVDLGAEEQTAAFLRFAGLDGGDPDLVGRALDALGGALTTMPPALFPHAAESLESLKDGGYAVGMVSNTGRTWGRYLREIQGNLGIGRFFDARVFSDEVGVRKPEPGIFSAALAQLRLPAERVVHIGDDVDADVLGAKSVGMRAIWFRSGGSGHRPGYGQWSADSIQRADATVRGHAEIPALLRRWGR